MPDFENKKLIFGDFFPYDESKKSSSETKARTIGMKNGKMRSVLLIMKPLTWEIKKNSRMFFL
jgi:hypothetical protein